MNTVSADVASPTSHSHEASNSRWLTKWLIGGGLVAGAIIVAPHLIPYLDPLLSTDFALDAQKVSSLCIKGAGDYIGNGTGIAGWISGSLEHIPGIGTALAGGGYANTLASGAIGIGGSLLGHYIHRNAKGETGLRWGNIIKTACLMTSIFIALPAILPALGMGITFLTAMVSASAANVVGAAMITTLGSVSTGIASIPQGFAVGALVVPHLLTCGLSVGSGLLSLLSGTRKVIEKPETPLNEPAAFLRPNFTDRVRTEPRFAQAR